MARFQQTNTSDFFFGFGQTSKVSSTISTNVDSNTEEQESEPVQISHKFQEVYEEELACGQVEYDRPPTPPLASANINLEDETVQDIGDERWEEGVDQKWKSFQTIRREKRRFWA